MASTAASVFLLLLNVAVQAASPGVSISGIVVDWLGNAVPGATVRMLAGGTQVDEALTTTQGQFELRARTGADARLIVTATGFVRVEVVVADPSRPLRVTLQPAAFFDEVNVTASRADVPRSDPNVTVSIFSSARLLNSAPMTIDDALKMVPGFTLFRRTSSRVSNPTSQGMTVRGLGGSGASRSLVLADGVPLNDAFGGWIYWDKVPQAAIDRIEVLRGGGSDLYGADAVAGVIQIVTLSPGTTSGRALIEGGTGGTGRISLFGGGRRRGWRVTGAGEWFTTDGYLTVAELDRGPVDTPAASTHRSAMATLGYQAARGWRLDGRATLFSEDRKNGTPAQVNDTRSRHGSAELASGAGRGLLSLRVFGASQRYHQTFSIISAEPLRVSEDLNRIQRVPTRMGGVAVQWLGRHGRTSFMGGGEGRFISGHTVETRLDGDRVLGVSDDGGRQRLSSAFVRATVDINERLTFTAGTRADRWHSESQNTPFARTVGAISPRVSLLYRLGSSGLAVRGSLYRAFRAPTLNELYRGFRVGNNVTVPNEALEPERLRAGEAGVLLDRGRASARVTGFVNVLDNTITNATVSTSPELNVRQRANADKVQAQGVELEGGVRLPWGLSSGVSLAVIDSRFRGDTTLRSNRVPQVANYTFGLALRYTGREWNAAGHLRVTGPQFEDDVNALRLGRATVLDVTAGRPLMAGVNIFVAVENLFDALYDTGRVPARTIGLPRTTRVGVQVALP